MPELFDLPARPPGRFDQSSPSQGPVKQDITGAGPGQRCLGLVGDWLVPAILFFAFPEPLRTLIWLGMLGNWIVLQGLTGQSVGKRMAGISLAYIPQRMSETVWTPLLPGVLRCAARTCLHLLDTIFFIGSFRMLVNPWSQTFADSVCHTVVIRGDGKRLKRRDEWLRGPR